MRIAVLGTGPFGSQLGAGLAARGHEVVHGARNLDSRSVRRLLDRHPGTEVVALAEAVGRGELVIVATAPDSLDDIAAVGGFGAKIVVDTTNALDWVDGRPGPAPGPAQARVLAELLPAARVVKAFNTLRADHVHDARFAPGRPVTFVCGDDDEARAVVSGLALELGFEPVDVGRLEHVDGLEQAAAFWIGVAATDDFGRRTALSVTHRSG